ncbi:unnamed protein product [Hymenolepis diminuta]|uniref:Uncharacterized protein n=1 Tax=Hymenolepis diminuta TaxID=6216 RepID=A0A564Z4W6_HYMDI|nr:unnamed protein product [Hymenolepis diminuta]
MTIYREMKRLGWECLKGWEMGPTWEMGFVRNQQVTACDLLCCTAFPRTELQAPFLDRIITDSNEKWWILYNNVKRKRQWLSQDSGSKPIPQPRQFGTAPGENSFVCMVGFEGNCLL